MLSLVTVITDMFVIFCVWADVVVCTSMREVDCTSMREVDCNSLPIGGQSCRAGT